MGREDRPADECYYDGIRTTLLSQGDVFDGVPLAFPSFGYDLAEDEEGIERLVSGPLKRAPAMLITPTSAMTSHSGLEEYEHDVRTLVPLLPVAALMSDGSLTAAQLRTAKRIDGLINYMYLPPLAACGMPESLAALFMPIPLDHETLAESSARVTQLAPEGARQLKRKLAWYFASVQLDRKHFHPPMD